MTLVGDYYSMLCKVFKVTELCTFDAGEFCDLFLSNIGRKKLHGSLLKWG